MNDQLVIRISDTQLHGDSALEWVLYDEAGHFVSSGTDELPEIKHSAQTASEAFSVSLVAPATACLITTTQIPSRNNKQVRQALPFMVEELIADDIETVHIAIPRKLPVDNQRVDCVVVSHRLLIDWLDQFHSNDLSPDHLYVDALCIPFTNNSISIFVDDDQLLIRSMDYSAIAIPAMEFTNLFTGFLAQHEHANDPLLHPGINLVYSGGDEKGKSIVDQLWEYLSTEFSDYECKKTRYEESPTAILAGNIVHAHSPLLNVLQGGYAVSKKSQTPWQQWRIAASLAGVGLIAYLALALSSGYYFSSQAKQMDATAVSIYKQLFPNERRVVSPQKQMQNHLRLANVSANAHFLELLAETSVHMGGESATLQVEQLRFDSDKGGLQFQVQSPSIEQLDILKQQLAQAGMAVDINSAIEQDKHVLGRFVVRNL